MNDMESLEGFINFKTGKFFRNLKISNKFNNIIF